MPQPDRRHSDRGHPDRRREPRSRLDFLADALYTLLRAIARRAGSFYQALGIYIVAGAAVASLGTWAFAEFAGHVRSGSTQAFERSLLEITALGTGTVVMTIVAVAALFLSLTEHRYSALLLLVATAGGIVLNNVLKLAFDRPRPQLFEWGTTAVSSSFPSGHSMSAVIVYSTVAYLAARLQRRWWQRALTMLVALVVVVLVCVSRLYLGVHYPSDVLGGTLIGLAWAAFCMAGLEAVQVFAKRFRPRVLRHERDLDPREREAAGLPT
jgi:undecaprenyl-diphosphatase